MGISKGICISKYVTFDREKKYIRGKMDTSHVDGGGKKIEKQRSLAETRRTSTYALGASEAGKGPRGVALLGIPPGAGTRAGIEGEGAPAGGEGIDAPAGVASAGAPGGTEDPSSFVAVISRGEGPTAGGRGTLPGR